MLLKPLDCLQESALLGILGHLVAQVTSDSEAVLHPTVEIDLIGQACLLQDLLRLVPLLCREDGVGFCSADAQWALDLLQLLGLDKAWMSTISHFDLALVGSQVPDDVLGPEAVADSANPLAT
jgi:hypothetical protein